MFVCVDIFRTSEKAIHLTTRENQIFFNLMVFYANLARISSALSYYPEFPEMPNVLTYVQIC